MRTFWTLGCVCLLLAATAHTDPGRHQQPLIPSSAFTSLLEHKAVPSRRPGNAMPLSTPLLRNTSHRFLCCLRGGNGQTPLVQQIFRHAKSSELNKVMDLMSRLRATDVGLEEGAVFSSRWSPSKLITYIHIWEDTDLSMGVFVLPRGCCIPVHDHPNMKVLSSLLYGSVRVTSFDKEQQMEAGSWMVRAKGVVDKFASGPAWCLTPESSNLHQFEALEDCAIFDVLTPPYSAAGGRECSYFRPREPDGLAKAAGSTLVMECYYPTTLNMQNIRYTGPRVPP